MAKQLTTKIDKAFLGRLCADAISNLERAIEKHPTFPGQISGCSLVVTENMLRHSRQINDDRDSVKTVCMIANEESLEMEVSIQHGHKRAAYDELVDLITVWLRVGCHLNDYVAEEVKL